MAQEETGKVKWFDARKRYGFIERDSGGEDVFVHVNGMADQFARTLEEGEKVSFVVGQGQKGPAAEQVRRIA